MGKNISVTAAIVLYENDEEEVKEAIESCLTSSLITKLYLIDNSTTRRLNKLSNNSRLVYLHNGRNMGFGAAHNKAIDQIIDQSDYHLILNPDIRFGAGVIEELGAFMEENPDIGSVMPKILYEDGTVQRLCKLLPSPVNLFGRRFAAKSSWVRQLDAAYELHSFDYDQVLDVPNLSGCFMFVKTSILRETGGFDPRYFMYLEDLDLVRRIGQIARTVFYPHVSVIHAYRKGSYKNGKLMRFHIQSALKYFNKWGWFFDATRSIINKKTERAVAKFRR